VRGRRRASGGALPPVDLRARQGLRMSKALVKQSLLALSERPAASSGGLEDGKLRLYKLWLPASEGRAALFFAGRPLHFPTLQLPQAGMRASAACLRQITPI